MEHKRNRITISDLDELTAEKIAGLPVADLSGAKGIKCLGYDRRGYRFARVAVAAATEE